VEELLYQSIVAEATGFGEEEGLGFGAPAGGDAGEAFGERGDLRDAEGAPEGEDGVAAHDEDALGVVFFDVGFGGLGEGLGDGIGVGVDLLGGFDDGDVEYLGVLGLTDGLGVAGTADD
jgi:hypothetical protein